MNIKTVRNLSENLADLREFVRSIYNLLDTRIKTTAENNTDRLRLVFDYLVPLITGGKSATIHRGEVALPDIGWQSPYSDHKEAIEKIEQEFDAGVVVEVSGEGPQRGVVIGAQGPGAKHLMASINSGLKTVEVLTKLQKQRDLLLSGALTTLTSIAERFISTLFHQHCTLVPEAYGADDPVLSLAELRQIESVEKALEKLVEIRVSKIMYGGFEDWIKHLKSKAHLSMGYLDDSKDAMHEVFQRRHLIVHNGGVVNSQYLSSVAPSQINPSATPGKKVGVDIAYVQASIDLFELNLTLTAAELWKQVNPKDRERGDLVDVAFRHLMEERWSVAEGVSAFVMRDKVLSERARKVALVNYWQAVKWQGRYESIRKDVEAADFSGSTRDFQLALHALRNDSVEFFRLLPEAIDNDLSIDGLKTFPVFREMRNTDEYSRFIEAYEASHADRIKLPLAPHDAKAPS